MRLLLLQEKYLELLEAGLQLEALQCLRHELAPLPLHHSDKNIQVLTSYMMCQDKEKLHKVAAWSGVDGGARQKLMDQLQGTNAAVCLWCFVYLYMLYMYIIVCCVEERIKKKHYCFMQD